MFCGREVQKSINDSVHQLFGDLIQKDLKLDESIARVMNNRIEFPETGSQITYGGLLNHTVDSVKSMEGCTIAWVEEAQRVSEKSWGLLIPTIRADDSEVWVSFNTDLESDPTYKRFITNTPPDSIVRKVGWQDNPYFNDILRAEKDYLKKTDYEAYLHVWEGEARTNSDAQIFKGKYRVEEFTAGDDWEWSGHGADWGFSVDPTTLLKCWIHNNRLWIEYEAYGVGVEFEEIPKLFDLVPDARDEVIRADSARPETINYVRRHGFPKIESVEKWQGTEKGYIRDGISFIRGAFEEIIIHPRCIHTQEEFRLYSYKIDKLTDEITTDIVDKNNHMIDSLRYALSPHIKLVAKPKTSRRTVTGMY